MAPLLYYLVPATSVFPHVLFIAIHNRTSVQSFNSSCICAISTPRQYGTAQGMSTKKSLTQALTDHHSAFVRLQEVGIVLGGEYSSERAANSDEIVGLSLHHDTLALALANWFSGLYSGVSTC